jgi:hypothetical protein
MVGGGREMVRARLLTNCSNTRRNIYTSAKENITRTRAKRKAGYFSCPILYVLFINECNIVLYQ